MILKAYIQNKCIKYLAKISLNNNIYSICNNFSTYGRTRHCSKYQYNFNITKNFAKIFFLYQVKSENINLQNINAIIVYVIKNQISNKSELKYSYI